MNKNAIQKYAIWARNELIEQVKQRAFQYGISADGYGEESAITIHGRVLTAGEKAQRQAFIAEIKRSNFVQAVEGVAYTWFNRFIALRYMEVNDFLPTHIRVFSDWSGSFKPEILREALRLELAGLDKSKVMELLNANKIDDLYRYLLLIQCNALNEALPEMFERLGGYTEMLLPNNILKADGVLGKLVTDIPEEDWRDAVQIIGWMYQYWNTEPKAEVDTIKKKQRITKEQLPAVTQIFTPDWIVRYMVENSLGRLWLEGHPTDAIKKEWQYYLDEAEQTPEVAAKLLEIRKRSQTLNPESITVLDPCMGSGHILVYAFDVLMGVYRSAGYSDRDASRLILEKNLFGLDIDRRAFQLAYFALMMKARQYNRRIFEDGVKPQVYHPQGWSEGEEYGSLIKVDTLPEKPQKKVDMTLFDDDYDLSVRLWHFRRVLSQQYDVVITNPPYQGASDISSKLDCFLKSDYPDSKSDLFAAFIEQCLALSARKGFCAMITQQAWMFLSSYEKLRSIVQSKNTIASMVHLGQGSFGMADFGLTSFVLRAQQCESYKGIYFRLVESNNPEWKENAFLSKKHRFIASSSSFDKIPGRPIVYWANELFIKPYNGFSIKNYGEARSGLQTGNNDVFLKYWFEVNLHKIAFDMKEKTQFIITKKKWVPQIKGGEYRKWYGNFDYIVNWENDGSEIRKCDGCRLNAMANDELFFARGITWSHTTSSVFGARYLPTGFLFNVEAPTFFPSENNGYYILGFLNSSIAQFYLNMVNATMHYLVGNIKDLPLVTSDKHANDVSETVYRNVSLSRADWDAFETSWDFKRHPLI